MHFTQLDQIRMCFSFHGSQLRWFKLRKDKALHNPQIFCPFPSHDSSSSLMRQFLWKYFLIKAFFHHSLESERSLQTILAPNARFISSWSFTAIPPKFLGFLTKFQFTRCNLCLLALPPCHNNFLMSLLLC